MDERTKEQDELESILMGLMNSLGISEVRMMLSLAIIRAYQIHEEMVDWFVEYYKKEGTMTAQAFMSKLDELTGSDQDVDEDE